MKIITKVSTAVILGLLINAFTLTAQTVGAINTGIADLDADLNEVNALADKDIVAFTNMVATDYNTTVSAVNNIISSGLKPAETLLAFAVGSITNKSVDQVVKTYKANKGQGWGVVAMQLGIKPGSPEFHQLKGKCKANKDKFKKIKGKNDASIGTIQPSNDKEKSDKSSTIQSDKGNIKKSDDDKNKGNEDKGNSGKGNGNDKSKGKGK